MSYVEEVRKLIGEALSEARKNKPRTTKQKKSEEDLLSEAILQGILKNQFGEEMDVLITLNDGDKQITSKSAEKKRREHARRFFESKNEDERGTYIQLLHESNDKLHAGNEQITSKKDKWTLLHDKYTMLLVPYADINQKGLIVDPITKKPLNGADIASHLKISVKNASPVLKALVNHGVLIERKAAKNQKHYQFNDDILNINGRDIKSNEHFTKVFQQTLSQIIEKISGNEIGLLRVLASRFHYQSYFLVENPHEDLRIDKNLTFQENFEKYGKKVFNKLRFLKMSEIMKLADIQHPHTLLDYIELLEDAGAILLTEIKNGKRGRKRRVKRRIRVHPNLMYRERGSLNERYIAYMSIDFDVLDLDGGEDDF